LLTVAAYIDLNPVAAGVAALPESSPHTSIKERVDHVVAAGKLENVEAIRKGSVAAHHVSEGVENGCWLIPIEDQHCQGGTREGFKEGFTLGQYLMLVDCTSRAVRDDKQSVTSRSKRVTRAGWIQLSLETSNVQPKLVEILLEVQHSPPNSVSYQKKNCKPKDRRLSSRPCNKGWFGCGLLKNIISTKDNFLDEASAG
jgi:hypothetical protein